MLAGWLVHGLLLALATPLAAMNLNRTYSVLETPDIATRYPNAQIAVCTESLLMHRPFGTLVKQEEYVMGAASASSLTRCRVVERKLPYPSAGRAA